jgi:hypothetical protein
VSALSIHALNGGAFRANLVIFIANFGGGFRVSKIGKPNRK